jgi:eukaryotic-like serine/threonine-protein kinase
VLQVLRGLSALHEANIVHRDIKLENLFLCADGHVEILDLGAAARMGFGAKGAEGDPKPQMFKLGEDVGERAPSLGTPRTMAPEQYEGKPIDGRADLYALGIVLYELLTGRGPFDDVSGLEALRFAHCHRKPIPPSRVDVQFIPPEIDALILRALAKVPEERFASAEAMAMEIAALRTASLPAAVSATSIPASDAPVSSLVRVTIPSRWRLSQTWSSFLQAMLKPFTSPIGLASIALLALLMATLALGVAAGRRLPRLDVVVQYVQ